MGDRSRNVIGDGNGISTGIGNGAVVVIVVVSETLPAAEMGTVAVTVSVTVMIT